MAVKKAKTINRKAKKNPALLTAFAETAVGLSAAVGLYDRFKGKDKPMKAKKSNRNFIGLKENASASPKMARVPAKKTLKTNGVSPQETVAYRRFEKLLSAIEAGHLEQEKAARIQGKLAKVTPNEIARAVQYARLTYKLKQNPTIATVKAAQNAVLKSNGLIGRALARHKAGKLYKRQLRLEAAIGRAKSAQRKAEARAKKNPAVKPIAKKKATKKNPVSSKSFEAFQGRKPTTAFQSPSPKTAPKTLYALGTLLELRLRGKQNIDFRKETTGKKFYLCADERNKQLWIVGGSVANADKTLLQGYSDPYAVITHIVYETQKVHLGDTGTQGYIHRFGEEGGKEPILAFDAEGFPIVVGGSYTITPLGIAD